ncbi:ergothioneine biosynthesis protein EgtC [Gloeocapsopsis dulcis]|uniref:Ergothioneine biosynthesis protein EgtC n=1 Tax=Gloeocapsopsis dulcis AAB1 = 1H9 TaxID=1433147 RepID=A0A6N8FRA8_9CHRO|nr:ergothioneine biosynthesis protein EgtC [Gloeocapsopsis dulcis]MUL35680.1 ergothioneine biosynthesis protein EgtC [Gloeocapsopsis dulcis AAB1 = 1H9]WNN91038.1 ergothioneine biosynthesis protein EgtC [Gloeocapsopsis dulcis]
MCRLLAYLGSSILLDRILTKPEHSLVVQSYQPREMNSGLLNADGFGIGWYHAQKDTPPFTYKNVLPIWNDTNLSSLGRYIESRCILGAVRSATLGQAVDLSNCQPFNYQQLLCIHNGRIENFREALARPLRDRLSDVAYKSIKGSTDSEHFFALIIEELYNNPTATLTEVLQNALLTLDQLAKSYDITASANLIISDGQQLVASRFATNTQSPSLYWLRDDPTYPESVIIASEPLFAGNWHPVSEQSILSVGKDLNVQIAQL